MERLQSLNVMDRVLRVLERFLGVSDRTLAEFIIALASEHPMQSGFASALAEAGAELKPELVTSIFSVIKALSGAQGGGGIVDDGGGIGGAGTVAGAGGRGGPTAAPTAAAVAAGVYARSLALPNQYGAYHNPFDAPAHNTGDSGLRPLPEDDYQSWSGAGGGAGAGAKRPRVEEFLQTDRKSVV